MFPCQRVPCLRDRTTCITCLLPLDVPVRHGWLSIENAWLIMMWLWIPSVPCHFFFSYPLKCPWLWSWTMYVMSCLNSSPPDHLWWVSLHQEAMMLFMSHIHSFSLLPRSLLLIHLCFLFWCQIYHAFLTAFEFTMSYSPRKKENCYPSFACFACNPSLQSSCAAASHSCNHFWINRLGIQKVVVNSSQVPRSLWNSKLKTLSFLVSES